MESFPSMFFTRKTVLPGRMLSSEILTLPALDFTVITSDLALSALWCVPEASAAPPVAAMPAVAVSSSAVAAAR